jgi:hypothetical protein
VDKVVFGQVFSEYFGFPSQFSFYRLLHIHHHLPPAAGTIGLVADVPSVDCTCTELVPVAEALQTCIRQVLGSNLGWSTSHSD